MISPVIEERIKRSLARVPESQQQYVADLVENFVEKQFTPEKREAEQQEISYEAEARLQQERDRELIRAIQARSIAKLPPGAPGSAIIEFVGSISHEDCELMKASIEEAFEQVEPNEW
jgi:hypothetical protein